MTDFIRAKLKQIVNLQDIIKTAELHYKQKSRKGRKVYNFIEYSLPMKDIYH